MKPPRYRIAVLSDRFPPNWGGGVASAHFHLCRQLSKLDVELRVFTYFDDTVSATVDFDISINRHSCPKWYIRVVRKFARTFFSFVDQGKVAYQLADILQRQWGSIGLYTQLRDFRPDILVAPDHGLPSLLIGMKGKTVLVAHHNPLRFSNFPGFKPFSDKDIRMAFALEKLALRAAKTVICPSRYMEDFFRKTHAFPGAVHTIPNLIDTDFIETIESADPRPALELGTEAPLLFVPGGGNAFKGARLLPMLFRMLAASFAGDLGVVITGSLDSQLRNELCSISPHIHILAPGQLPGEKVIALMKACSLCIYPTLADNYSMALLESAACGLPVVTFDVGGNGEIVDSGNTGYIVKPYDLAEMHDRVVDLLAQPEKRAEMSRRAAETIRSFQGSEQTARDYLQAICA